MCRHPDGVVHSLEAMLSKLCCFFFVFFFNYLAVLQGENAMDKKSTLRPVVPFPIMSRINSRLIIIIAMKNWIKEL